ncbi:protein phosphatase 1 regulatory subunit 14B isoform X1 [Petromyzon marinus]|uniref:protein phosphatase 1 regulatory subunit 14B isoform X1 n=1 Tax=Petromyzon marinus TaxID=7757 RepID=UPI003F70DFD3
MSESSGARVCFEAEAGAEEEGECEGEEEEDAGAGAPGRRQGKVTVKYNRRELQRRLDLEGWVDERLTQLYACPVRLARHSPTCPTNTVPPPWGARGVVEEEMPELEIDIDHLLELNTDEERAEQLREILQACANSPEGFITDLLSSLKGMKKLNNGSRK